MIYKIRRFNNPVELITKHIGTLQFFDGIKIVWIRVDSINETTITVKIPKTKKLVLCANGFIRLDSK